MNSSPSALAPAGSGAIAIGRGTFGAMTDSDSFPADQPGSWRDDAADEAGTTVAEHTMSRHPEPGIAAAATGELGDDAARQPGRLPAAVAGTGGEDPGRTDDPMTMYLRDVGGTAILSRGGEVALAKRIEAGRQAVLDGLCGSMTAIRTVSGWRDAIREGSLALRHVIDVEAAYEGDRTDRHGSRGADRAGGASG